MRRAISALAAFGLLALLLAPTTLATTTRVGIEAREVLADVLDEGSYTQDGTTVSARGVVWVYDATGSGFVAGTDTVTINYDIDFATGIGELWGTDRIEPSASSAGRFDCSWHGTMVDYMWTGNAVCHGDGSLAHWQLRLVLHPEPGGEVLALRGYAFMPGS